MSVNGIGSNYCYMGAVANHVQEKVSETNAGFSHSSLRSLFLALASSTIFLDSSVPGSASKTPTHFVVIQSSLYGNGNHKQL